MMMVIYKYDISPTSQDGLSMENWMHWKAGLKYKTQQERYTTVLL
jgi:hypothetical protein